MRPEFIERFGGPFRNFEQRTSECASVPEALEHNYVVDRNRKKRVGFGRKESHAIFDGGIYDRIAIELVRDRFVVSFEKVLVDAVVVVEQLERRFEALCEAIERVPIKALVINTPDLKNDSEVARLGQEHMGINKPVEVYLLIERAGLFVVLEDSPKLK